MDKKLFIPILLGTDREPRMSEKVANFLLPKVQAHPDIETQLFDVAAMNMPATGEGEDLKDQVPQWRDAIIRADGLIIISPEYNHGYSGSLKRVLDTLLREYVHKAVGLVGVSSGGWGGVRGIEALVNVVRELGLTVTFTDLQTPRVEKLFDAQGNMTDPAYDKRIDSFLTELVWMAKVLRWGRENVPSKFHAA